VIERAKQIIVESLKNSGSFLQKKSTEVMMQVSAHFTKHAKAVFKRKSWNQIFSLLAQITAAAPIQADQSLVQKVIDLTDKLLAKISESREIERRDYQHWLEEYTTTFNQLSEKEQALTAEIDQLESEIDTLTKRINAAKAEKHDTEVRRDQKQDEHDERLTYCDQENVNYAERRQQRDDEIEVVSDAVSLLQSHLRLFRQYVSDRLTTVHKAA
jgi:outer membrane murein-binding lipoprotein Lpp